MAEIRWPCFFCRLLLTCRLLVGVTADTHPDDVTALTAIKAAWRNTPPTWGITDPCDTWEGVECTSSRVTSLKLSSMGLGGGGIDGIGSLTQLQVLDLSLNRGLSGSIPPSIGSLTNLTILTLAACSFTGTIPEELGNLEKLTFLALNSNKLAGNIPPSFGKLSNVYWLDFAGNMLTGELPISSGSTPGLDMLVHTKHFHFSRNQLSGTVPPELFSSEMKLKQIRFDGNKFSGPIPATIGLLSKLEVLRLEKNSFSGTVPPNLSNLTSIIELNLAANQLTGPLPNLTDMKDLNYVDLSNNSFDASAYPSSFTTIRSLMTVVLEFGALEGEVPQGLFSQPSLQRVKLKNNSFNGTLDIGMGYSISTPLGYVDLQNNQISGAAVDNGNVALMLAGNPVCSPHPNASYCLPPPRAKPYSTSLANCGNAQCLQGEKLNPRSCECAYPYQGLMHFRAIYFSDLSDATAFQALERELWTTLHLEAGSVFVENPFFDSSDYVQLQIALFPSTGKYFNRSEVSLYGSVLTNQLFTPPPEFGSYDFEAFPYRFPEEQGGRSFPSGAVIGIVVGFSVLVIVLLALGVFAIRQKRRRAEKDLVAGRPFASWGGNNGKDSWDAPRLKGAWWFSFDEVKKCTDNFSTSNEVGSGGFGKVYWGTLPDGQMVAIKRARQGSTQGGVEFKAEIEVLSRVHHKNLVSLVGFCFDHGEKMLVYEFVPNGTLKDSLSGRSGIHLDWKRRLHVSLESARGLAYLHELADPPLIHRDVKSANILLGESLVAKVADFGLSKLVADNAEEHVSTHIKGTLGYLDPEYYSTHQATEKSDVYSFGVVMLELITAKPPIERGNHIVKEVRLAIDKSKEACGLGELLDPAIGGVALAGFEKFVDLAMRCVEESASDRPTMGEVVMEIETILQNEGVNINPASASSSANDFGTSNDPLPADKGAPTTQ